MKLKSSLLNLLLACIFTLAISCQPKTVEELAEKDANTFFSNLDDAEKLAAHPWVIPVNIPEELAEQNRAKSIERLQNYFSEVCKGDPKDFNLLKTYRKIGDDNQKILFLEYEFCTSGMVIMGYEVEENDLTLFSVWPKKKDDKPEVLFSDKQEW
ncbi:hypothetical protein [Algoriphagus litoralis]|uniref:hypothetical protein n=1 Tax=Algoriphagus litoralis TaxID=2202829 RepID=UPI000DB9CC64|nr:hypothetical protein [Algoriphagus litoralis]